jgi:Ca-activated chloride channel family protein
VHLKRFAAVAVAGTLASSGFSIQRVCAASDGAANSTVSFVTPGGDSDLLKRNFGKAQDSGAMHAVDITGRDLGQCPLKHTDVDVTISGYVAGVSVEQVFENPYNESIEAIYTFPLSDSGAVNEMVLEVGGRTIKGTIHKRAEARDIYDSAKSRGRTASLLEQERTNIFTQSVANIPAKSKVKVTLKYVDLLSFDSGRYTFAFPMVVGPRYMPGASTGKEGTGWSPDTTVVPDASKISPPVMPEKVRAGHDISLRVKLNAGMPVSDIKSALHEIVNTKDGDNQIIKLAPSDNIPNRDFILSWSVGEDKIKSGCLTYNDGKEGFFNLMVVPPARPTVKQICPRELNFIIDRSGSQRGMPLQKARETMLYILDRLNPNDTFQILSFSNGVEKLFYKAMPPSPEAISEAKKYIASLDANGGTEMKHAVEQAMKEPAPDHRLRIFTIMTDGLIGNDRDIVSFVKRKREGSRWFSFGTGNSVNRMLIDGVAKAGGGEAQYVVLNSNGEAVAKEFFDRISTPVLSDITLNFKGVTVTNVLPTVINDVWARRPLYICGKYTVSGSGSVTVKGFSGGKPYEQTVPIQLPEKNVDNAVLPAIWARAKVDEITESLNFDDVSESGRKEYIEQIEEVAIKYKLLTTYTSFVAVDEDGKTVEPSKRTSVVGVEAPDGMDMNGVFGNARQVLGRNMGPLIMQVPVSNVQKHQFQVEPTVIDERDYAAGRDAHVMHSPSSPSTSSATPSFYKAPLAMSGAQRHTYPDTIPPNSAIKGQPQYSMGGYNINRNMRNRNFPAMRLADGDYVVSSLGLPASSGISPDVFKFDSKLDNALQKLLRMPERQKELCSISINYSGERDELLSKLKKLKFTVSTPEDDTAAKVITLKDVPFERIHELLPLTQIEHISIQSLN